MRLGVVFVVVDPEHDRHVWILRGRGDDDLRGAGVEVGRGPVAVGEEAGRLDHDVDAEVAPRQLLRIALGEKLELLAADGDLAVADLDVLLELAQDRVVLEQVRHRFGVPEVIRRDHIEVALPLQVSAEEVPPDPPEPVDADLCLRHWSSLPNCTESNGDARA